MGRAARDGARPLWLGAVVALLVTRASGQASRWSSTCSKGCGGTNIIISADGQVTELANQSALPDLPVGTEYLTFGAAGDTLDGTIVVAAPLSLNPSNAFYPISQVRLRR